MATEVEIDPSFQLKPDEKPRTKMDMANTKGYAQPSETRKSPRKSLMGVFKKKKNTRYESMEDTPPTAPSTPEGNDDLEIDRTLNVASPAEDPAFGFDADDDDNLMAMDVPDIFPHEGQGKGTADEQGHFIQPAQFKVPTQFEPEQEAVLDQSPGEKKEHGDVQAREIPESAHKQIGLVVAHTNDLAKNHSVFCTPLNGFYEEPTSQPREPIANDLQGVDINGDPVLKATKQRALITTSGVSEEYARHENFEVVLDPTYYSTTNGLEEKTDLDVNRINGAAADDAVLEIQRDLEGFERQMKEESKEEKQQRAQPETKQEAAVVPSTAGKLSENSQSPMDSRNKEFPLGTVEVSVEEPPEVKISVETQPTVSESKPTKARKTRKMNLGKLTKKVKAMSFKASVKASKVLKSVPVPVSSASKENKEAGPSSVPEKPTKPKAVWRAVKDPKSGNFYYYHRTTRETTWTKPGEYVAYERAMEKYERDQIAYEKYHHKPIEEVVIDTSIKAEDKISMERGGLSEEAEEKKDEDEADNFGRKNVEDEEEPFDERHSEPKPFDEAYDDPRLVLPLASQGRVASQFSTMTEKTQRINNVSSGSQISNKSLGSSLLDILDTDKQEHQSQVSSSSAIGRQRAPRYASRVSSNHRTRELRVEDLGSSRISAETFDKRGRVVKGREFSSNEERTCFSEQKPVNSFDHDDAISALSEMDLDHNTRRDNFNAARHRAVVDAIDRKDGDLLKALMAGMKASGNGMQQTYSCWNQNEIDGMIAQNDWDGVRSYVSAVIGTSVPKSVPQVMSPTSANVAPARSDKCSTDEIASMHTDYSA